MAALTGARNTREVYCNSLCIHRIKNKGSQDVHLGGICAIDSSGNVVPASDTEGLVVIGRAEAVVPEGKIIVKSGVFIYNNGTSTEALGAGDINKKVYIVDDQTVGKIGGTKKIVAGVLRDIISTTEVAVEIGNNIL